MGASPAVAATVSADAEAQVQGGRDARVLVTPKLDGGAPVGGSVAAARGRMVDAVKRSRGELDRSYENIPSVVATVDRSALAALASNPNVASVSLDTLRRTDELMTPKPVKGSASGPLDLVGGGPVPNPLAWCPLPYNPVPCSMYSLIGADRAWPSSKGAGRTVAILDTAIESADPYWKGRIVREACFVRAATCPGGTTSKIGAGSARVGSPAYNHGSLVTDTAAGPLGIAPDARVIFVRIFGMYSGSLGAYDSDILAGLDHVYSLRNQFDISAANMSLGGSDTFNSAAACQQANGNSYAQTFGLLRSAGIAPVVSAGNDGSAWGVSAPACHSGAIAVGATIYNAEHGTPDTLASFSNSGGTTDVLAPGYRMIAYDDYHNWTMEWSGTSASAPVITGTLAVMERGVRLPDVGQMEEILEGSGKLIRDPRNGVVKRRVDVEVARAKAAATSIDGPAIDGSPKIRMKSEAAFGYNLTSYCLAGYAGRTYSFIQPTIYGAACDAIQIATTSVAGLPPKRYRHGLFNLNTNTFYSDRPWIDTATLPSTDTWSVRRVLMNSGSAFGYDIKTYCTRDAEYEYGLGFPTVYGPACIAREVATTSVAGLPRKRVRVGFFNVNTKQFFETRTWRDVA